VLIGAAGTTAVAAISYPTVRKRYEQRGYPRRPRGGPTKDRLESDTTAGLLAVLSTYVGKSLSDIDKSDLSSRLDFLTRENSGWLNQTRMLMARLDAIAQSAGATSFLAADKNQQTESVRQLESLRSDLRALRIRSIVSDTARDDLMILTHTIGKLRRLYSLSGVPWRAHGYKSWPGMPGDPRAYTQAGPGNCS